MRKLTAGLVLVTLLQAAVVGAYDFSALADGQHLVFDPAVDVLNFDDPAITAAAVRVTQVGADLGFAHGGKTVWLDGVGLAQISIGPAANVTFANGSLLGIGDGTTDPAADACAHEWILTGTAVGQQVWGLGGSDIIQTGSGADWIVGNDALAVLNHVSRIGAAGSPTASSQPTVSADGRFIAFAGGWTGFGSSSDSNSDVLVKDMVTGTVANEHQDGLGTNGNSGAGAPAISADGAALAFHSASSNLVPGPDSGALYDVFVAEVGGSGIERVSTGPGGVLAADGRCQNPDVSGDGRYVVFESATSNFAAGGSVTTYDIYLKDRLTGDLTRLSTSLTGGDGDGDSTRPRISTDGRFVAFQSAATNLTSGDTNGYTDVFLWDRTDGSLTNLTAGVAATNPNNGSFLPDVTDDGWSGAVVVFQTGKGLVAADTCNSTDVYAFRAADGSFTLVSSRADGSCVGAGSGDASVSGDGRFVAFTGSSDTLVPGDANGVADVFLKDLANGAIALVSKAATGTAASHASGRASLSLGGDWIVFESGAANLASTDANGTFPDVFVVENPFVRDTLVGGPGNDTYVLGRPDVVVEQAGGGSDTVLASLSYTLGANLENLTLAGSANLSGTGNSLNNVITGNAGNNVLSGSGGVDTASYATASAPVRVSLAVVTPQATGAGTDTLASIENLIGSPFHDHLTGDASANRLDGGPGGDVMTGGAGNDTYVCGANTDIVVELDGGIDTVISAVTWTLGGTLENLTLSGSDPINGTGNNAANIITGNSADNTLNGRAGDDTLRGAAGNDRLEGGEGDDRLDGGPGSDTMVGGAGNDTYVCDANTDIVVEIVNPGIDTVISSVTWTLGGTLENLTLAGTATINGTGNNAANFVTGNAAANTLYGGAGDDTVRGLGGDDSLHGGAGNDTLTGGAGADSFVLDSTVGADAVTDYTVAVDRVAVSMNAIRVGDRDAVVEGALTRSAPGGFGPGAELVLFTANQADLTPARAAAGIGSATARYAAGDRRLFVVDNGASSAVFLFASSGADALVSAGELTLLATLNGRPNTRTADYAFVY